MKSRFSNILLDGRIRIRKAQTLSNLMIRIHSTESKTNIYGYNFIYTFLCTVHEQTQCFFSFRTHLIPVLRTLDAAALEPTLLDPVNQILLVRIVSELEKNRNLLVLILKRNAEANECEQ
jgi:hypothetical protein